MEPATAPINTAPYSAARLAARSLLHRLDRERLFQPFFNLKVGDPYAYAEHASWDYCDMSGRFTDAWILARQMLDWPVTEEEKGVRRFLLAMQSPEDGLFYDRKLAGGSPHPNPLPLRGCTGEGDRSTSPVRESANGTGEGQGESRLRREEDIQWDDLRLGEPETADMFCQSRALMGLVSMFLESGSTEIEGRIEKLVSGLWNVAAKQDDFCYYPGHRYSPKGWEGVSAYAAKDLGHAALPAYGVCQLIPLVRCWEATRSTNAERLILGLIVFFVRESTVIRPDGSFTGHLHSWGILPSTVGVLRYAMAEGDEERIEWCRRVYDFIVANSSSFGWVPDGIGVSDGIETGETCCITDLIHLGVKLAECGHTECLDYVEIMLRNHLIENQVREPDRFRFDPANPEVREMFHGSYDSWVMPNDLTGCSELGMEGCCTASSIRAVYLAWKHALVERDGAVYVNLMLSRRSESVDVLDFQPFEGRLGILVHKPATVFVRIPSWIGRQDLRIGIDGMPADPEWHGGYVRLPETRPGSRIGLEFPIPERRTEEFIRGTTYILQWRGQTLMRIEPPGVRYPIFQRTLDRQAFGGLDINRTQTKPSVEW